MASTDFSPPTDRVVAVVNRFLAEPERAYGLTELSDSLGISKPTCLRILTRLTEHGWLHCDPNTRAYSVGPVLVASARRLHSTGPSLDIAVRHLTALAQRTSTTCAISMVAGEEIVILASNRPDGSEDASLTGLRYPFAPPVGFMFALWDGDEAVEEWLARPPSLPWPETDATALRRLAQEGRERGYIIERLSEIGSKVFRLQTSIAAHDLPDTIRDIVGELVSSLAQPLYSEAELNEARSHPVHFLAAPTFDSAAHQRFVLSVVVGATLTIEQIEEHGRALLASADALTAETGGVSPRHRHGGDRASRYDSTAS